jgi:hypothetical protein
MHRRILKDMHERRVVAGEMFRSLALPILPDRPESLNSDRASLPGPTMILKGWRLHGPPLFGTIAGLRFSSPVRKLEPLGRSRICRGVFLCLVGWRGVVLGQLEPLAGTVTGTVGHKFSEADVRVGSPREVRDRRPCSRTSRSLPEHFRSLLA